MCVTMCVVLCRSRGNMETTVAEEKRYNPRLTKDVEAFVELMNNLNLPYPKMIGKFSTTVCGGCLPSLGNIFYFLLLRPI